MAVETITDDAVSNASAVTPEDASPPAKKRAPRKKRAPAKKSPKTTGRKTATKKAAVAPPVTGALGREVGGLLFLACGLALLLAILSFGPADNLIGPAGNFVADVLLTVLGLGGLCVDILFWYVGLMLLVGKRIHFPAGELFGQLVFVAAGTMLAHLALDGALFFGHQAGGLVGELSAELLRGLFGTVGTYIIAGAMLVLSLMLVTDMSLGALTRAMLAQIHRAYAWMRHKVLVHLEYRARLSEERKRLEAADGITPKARAKNEVALAATPIAPESYGFEARFEDDVETKLSHKLGRLLGRTRHARDPEEPPAPKKARVRRKKAPVEPVDGPPEAPPAPEASWSLGEPLATDPDLTTGNTLPVLAADVVDISAEQAAPSPTKLEVVDAPQDEGEDGPRIVTNGAKEHNKRIAELLSKDDGSGVLFKPQRRGDFELPALSFLNYEQNQEDVVDINTLRQMAAQIEQTLRDFKVEGNIKDICPGPVITVFEFSPAPGVKISKIANLSDDLAMALSALSVRIVAPIPGKGVVGIEVPNPKREVVFMKEVLAEDTFLKNEKMSLPMGLGKDTAGNCVVADLARMPHLLVAGATGSGKSVAVNTMITSLLYKNSPDDVRMIMVDPKMLEFSIYADIPHLLLPVVTDPSKATTALNWAVQEMERRYQMLADLSVRNIGGYNDKVDRLTLQAQRDMEDGIEESSAIAALGIDAQGKPQHERLPYIVVIIDEFADLMMTASKDVETAVARLAQKARAAGIHLILATQRPSTDVITGLIKANFPTRIALRVTSKTDSRVILDSNGAENLLGMGDMLFVPPGSSHVKRVHGAYVSETEIEQIVDFLKSQGTPDYNEEILAADDEDAAAAALAQMDRDEHYEDAVRLVVESRQASISMIQRKLRVGYNRSARMVEMMELEGIVSAPDGCKPREVLLDASPY